MITAVDSSILLDIFGRDAAHLSNSLAALRRCQAEGSLVACEVVWAEVLAASADPGEAEAALDKASVTFVPMDRRSARRAAQAWGGYRARGGPRTRVVADFLIGAHALEHADRLLTRDRGFFRRAFERLTIVDPSSEG